MPWVRLDEQFPDHPKVVTAGPLAGWLHVCGLAYCNRLLTDGFIPVGQVGKLADFSEVWDNPDGAADFAVDPYRLASKLCDVGMWKKVTGGYLIHDYHDYQPTKAQVMAERAAKAEAGRKGGLASAAARAGSKNEAEGQARAEAGASSLLADPFEAEGQANGKQNPSPTRPDTDTDLELQTRVTRSPSKTLCLVPPGPPSPTAPARSLDGFEPFWNAYPRRDGKRLGRTKAEQYWRRMTTAERAAATVGAKHLANAIAGGGKFGPPDAERWLRDRKWLDWQEPANVLHVSNGQSALMRAQARGNQ